jgi:hypothetical protein
MVVIGLEAPNRTIRDQQIRAIKNFKYPEETSSPDPGMRNRQAFVCSFLETIGFQEKGA